LIDLPEILHGDREWLGEVFGVLTLGIFFALWTKIGIFLKILNFDFFFKITKPLIPTLHGVIIYGPWAFQEY
jgi:hypothetical protein